MSDEILSVPLSSQQIEAVDVWRDGQPDRPSREDAVARLVESALRIPETLDLIRQDVRAAFEVIGEDPGS